MIEVIGFITLAIILVIFDYRYWQDRRQARRDARLRNQAHKVRR